MYTKAGYFKISHDLFGPSKLKWIEKTWTHRFWYAPDPDPDLDPNPEWAEMLYLLRFILLDISCNVLFKILKSFNNFLSYSYSTFFHLWNFIVFVPFYGRMLYFNGRKLKFSSSSILCLILVWMVQISRKISENIRSTIGFSKRH